MMTLLDYYIRGFLEILVVWTNLSLMNILHCHYMQCG